MTLALTAFTALALIVVIDPLATIRDGERNAFCTIVGFVIGPFIVVPVCAAAAHRPTTVADDGPGAGVSEKMSRVPAAVTPPATLGVRIDVETVTTSMSSV